MRAAILGALCAATLLSEARAGAAGVDWFRGSLAEAGAQARTQHKLVLVELYATWCVPCHLMEREVYPRDEVGRAVTEGYVALRRDGERGDGLEIARRHHVVGFPTLLVLDEQGAEVDRVMGSMSASDLVRQLARLKDGKGALAELERQLAQAPSEALRMEAATRHAVRGDPRAVAELTEVVRNDPENRARRAAAALLTLGKYYYLRGARDYARADSTLAELERRFPSTDEASQASYERAVAMQQGGRAKEARAQLDRWLEGGPNEVSRLAAYAWFCFKEGGDRARGIEIARRGLAIAPREDALWDTLGELYLAQGQRLEASQAFAKAVELAPSNTYYVRQQRKAGGLP